MLSFELISAILFFFGVFVVFSAILHLYYIGKTAAKVVDRIVYGYEFPNDSIFSLLIRAPGYASAFLWKWSARRSGLDEKIKNIDSEHKKPFIVNFYLFWFGGLCMIASVLLVKL